MKIHHELSGMSSNKQTPSMEHYLFIKTVNWREIGYLFCTMSSTEIIGSLITLSLWSRLEGQAHQETEMGAVFTAISCGAQWGWLPVALAPPVDPLSHRGSQGAGRWWCLVVNTTALKQGVWVQMLATTTGQLCDLGQAI